MLTRFPASAMVLPEDAAVPVDELRKTAGHDGVSAEKAIMRHVPQKLLSI